MLASVAEAFSGALPQFWRKCYIIAQLVSDHNALGFCVVFLIVTSVASVASGVLATVWYIYGWTLLTACVGAVYVCICATLATLSASP